MKKKLLLGAVLVLGLGVGLTGCVDDKESQSTTNVRNSKLEQLQSLANLDRSNAEAARILANAEKAAKEADAAYKQALAEYQNALAEYRNALTDADKQKLAIELEKKQVLLDQAKANLQSTLAQIEQDIAYSKYQTAKYEKDYNDLLSQIDADKAQEVKNLLDAYKLASETLIDAKKDLAKATVDLSKLEAGLTSISEALISDIEDLESKKVETAAKIEEQKGILATYEKYAGVKVTEQMIADAKVKYVEADIANKEAREKYDEAYNSLNEERQVMNKYLDEVRSWESSDNNFNYDVLTSGGLYEGNVSVEIRNVYDRDNSAPANARGNYCMVVSGPNNAVTYVPLFKNDEKSDYVSYEFTWPNWVGDKYESQVYTSSYNQYLSYYDLIDNGSGLDAYVAQYEKYIDYVTDPEYVAALKKNLETATTNQAAAQKKYDEADKAHATAKSELDKAEAAMDAAYKAWEDAEDDSKDEAWGKYEEAETKYDDARSTNSEKESAFWTAKNELSSANYNLKNAQSQLNRAEMDAENAANDLAELKEKVAETIALGKSVDLEKCNELIKAYSEANISWRAAYTAYYVSWSEYSLLSSNLNGYVDGNGEANQEVENAKSNIQAYEADLEQIDSDIAEKKETLAKIEAGEDRDAEAKKQEIADMKLEIEKLTVAVDVAQKKYDIAKAELDAVIKSDESAE